jgi:predicted nucleic acid-binding protein
VSFLLDTNAISEWQKPRPNPGVTAWMASVDERALFLSVVTLAELRFGIERMATGSRRRRYEQWLEHELPSRFEGRILAVNQGIADAWGRVVALCASNGTPISAIDGFLAATAQVRDLTLVTRNVRHFTVLTEVFNPWI